MKTYEVQYKVDGVRTSKIVSASSDTQAKRLIKGEIQECAGVWIYPKEYFCPLDQTLTLHITSNTRSIHHYDSSWLSPQKRIIKKIKRFLGYSFSSKLRRSFVFLHLINR